MIKVGKYINIDRGADSAKEYYINHNGTYISLTKAELEKMSSDIKLLEIGDVIGNFTLDDMRKSFLAGRDSVEAEVQHEHFGEAEAYAVKKVVKSFKTFIHELKLKNK